MEEYFLISRAIFKREKVQEVVEAAIQTFSSEAAEKGISFNLETEALEEDGHLFIDKGLVIKALFHILRNSMESITRVPAEKKRKTVKVTLSEGEESIGISISDKGEGIAKKNLDHIFEPFFFHSARSNGIGFNICQKSHGGAQRGNPSGEPVEERDKDHPHLSKGSASKSTPRINLARGDGKKRLMR